jgi:hypothetical protein
MQIQSNNTVIAYNASKNGPSITTKRPNSDNKTSGGFLSPVS